MNTTIAAISTGAAPGGIGIVRLSGPDALSIAQRVFRGRKSVSDMPGYTAQLGEVVSAGGEVIDQAILLVFRSPKSYTGEDVAELSCHGGLFVTRLVLQEVLRAGAVPAGPGEFTRRAFLNGKMDLTQAEAVMQLISAGGQQAARAARAAGEGVLSRRIISLRDRLSDLAAHLAAWADFPEEDVPAVEQQELASGVASGIEELSALSDSFDRGRVYRQGVDTVIAGRPNVGKSSLMNLLAGRPRSIVTQIPGTTRDIVEETVYLGEIPLHLADTAGLRDTEDPVEKIGVTAARDRLDTAELILAVFDSSEPFGDEDRNLSEKLDTSRTMLIVNKSDLSPKWDSEELFSRFPHHVLLSAQTGEGLAQLEAGVLSLLGGPAYRPQDGALVTERQQQECRAALSALKEARDALCAGVTWDAVTVCIGQALNALYRLTGEQADASVIDRVFETFCVGK